MAAGDLIAVILGALVAQLVRFEGFEGSVSGSGDVPYLVLSFVIGPLWVATLALCGVYEGRRLGIGSEEYRRILNAAVWFLAGVAVLVMALQVQPARRMLAIWLPLATVLTLVSHFTARKWLHRRRGAGKCVHRVLVVGTGQQVADLFRHFSRSTPAGFRVVGACTPEPTGEIVVDDAVVPVVGLASDVTTALRAVRADTLAIADHASLSNGALRRLGWQLEGTGVDLLVAPSVIDVAGPRVSIRPVAGLPLLHVEEPELSGFKRLVKEGGERVLAFGLLLLLSPVLLALGISVRLSSPGSALFRQRRVGKGGAEFMLYKFRTMRVGAEAERASLDTLNEHDGVLFKIRDDPRLVPVGRWLRRYSLDELPQLWNVVAGHMSIVGPRPPLPNEVARYSDEIRRRLLVKPGLTGLWQVSGRSNLPWEESVRLDLFYVENWSPALDMVILARTVTAVIRGHGAY